MIRAISCFDLFGLFSFSDIDVYMNEAEPMNSSSRPVGYAGGYSPELMRLVADKDKKLIDQFSYDFSVGNTFPKTESYRRLGTADTSPGVNSCWCGIN